MIIYRHLVVNVAYGNNRKTLGKGDLHKQINPCSQTVRQLFIQLFFIYFFKSNLIRAKQCIVKKSLGGGGGAQKHHIIKAPPFTLNIPKHHLGKITTPFLLQYQEKYTFNAGYIVFSQRSAARK